MRARLDPAGGFDKVNAIYRAGRKAELAARAQIGEHGVHELGCSNDGVHRAGLYALGAADALVFPDQRNDLAAFHPIRRIERNWPKCSAYVPPGPLSEAG